VIDEEINMSLFPITALSPTQLAFLL